MATTVAFAGATGAPTSANRAGTLILVVLVGLMLLPGRADAAAGEGCRDQAAIAERAAGVPEGLLLAIGKRESGRFDLQTGGVLPWPWAVNREGEGHIFETREEAIAYVAAALRAGSRSIDVGCFQINLKYHPIAFASLEEAFDPAANAAYAARFLTVLHDHEGNWEAAVADYHSASPLLGVPYREAVLATWRGAPEVASRSRPSSSLSSSPPEGLRVVMGIRIWTVGAASFAPGFETAPVAGHRVRDLSSRDLPSRNLPSRNLSSRNLPRVITPSAAGGGSLPAVDKRFGIRLLAYRR